jgi:hypothetical protein
MEGGKGTKVLSAVMNRTGRTGHNSHILDELMNILLTRFLYPFPLSASPRASYPLFPPTSSLPAILFGIEFGAQQKPNPGPPR